MVITWRCDHCQAGFPDPAYLRLHLQVECTQASNRAPRATVPVSTDLRHCPCGRSWLTDDALFGHLARDHGFRVQP